MFSPFKFSSQIFFFLVVITTKGSHISIVVNKKLGRIVFSLSGTENAILFDMGLFLGKFYGEVLQLTFLVKLPCIQ